MDSSSYHQQMHLNKQKGGAFVGDKILSVIKMHGATIKKNYMDVESTGSY